MKIWHCQYQWYCRGGIEEYDCICIAETKEKALEMAIKESGNSDDGNWDATEIPFEKGLTYISSRSH